MWYFRKKIGVIQVARQTIKFKKKKNAWALSKYDVTLRLWRRCHKGNDPTEEGISEGSSFPRERVHPLLFDLIIIFLFLLCHILISPLERGGVAERMAA